ncbi:MAG TPA: heparinase II/III family protein, partial [Gemmatimonadales bacterium]|nr:heparinase II/III family protein [Gemmatimonadales bacterium]
MVTRERLAARRAELAAAPDLQVLVAHLRERAAPLITRLPPIPEAKALLSADGGICPDDGATLLFDPWSPHAHRCPRCGQVREGERHDRAWARAQHLWLAERAAHLATLGALVDDRDAAARAAEILRSYAGRYWQYPNRDNVLGPSRLFFSTYLESIWITNYLAAATLLRESDRLDDATAKGVGQVAEEAANLIGEFDEGFSNRQTWNNAALTAIAAWFEDEELARRAVEGPTGLLEHLLRGFGRDGLWYEGENYHLFALRALLAGTEWAEAAGVDIYADPDLASRVARALLAPALSALPDFTFPARKDSPFGVSLAQPIHLELWEIGGAALAPNAADPARAQLFSWLHALYQAPAPLLATYDAYLHDAPIRPGTRRPPSRTTLSWWSLLFMAPALAPDPAPWTPGSTLLESQGLAVLRIGDRYVSLECGPLGGGHGHPDRLHLTLHAGGVHWLADPGTGSYVSRDLAWFRSTLAHNAPRLDGTSQPPGNAVCEACDTASE